MTVLFVSYSRKDYSVVSAIIDEMREVYGYPNVWFDEDLLGGVDWWKEICTRIAEADVFLYFLSDESIHSPYCQAELAEARRLQKSIVTIRLKESITLPPELAAIQWVTFYDVSDRRAYNKLLRSINTQVERAEGKRPRPLSNTPTPMPVTDDTPTLRKPVKAPRRASPVEIILFVGLILATIFFGIILILTSQMSALLATPTPDTVAMSIDTATTTASATDTETPTLTASPSQTQIPPTQTVEVSPTVDENATRVAELSRMLSGSQTASVQTQTAVVFPTPTRTASVTNSPQPSPTVTPSRTLVPTITPTATGTLAPFTLVIDVSTNYRVRPDIEIMPTGTVAPGTTIAVVGQQYGSTGEIFLRIQLIDTDLARYSMLRSVLTLTPDQIAELDRRFPPEPYQ